MRRPRRHKTSTGELDPPLDAAKGWLELANWHEALAALDRIPADRQRGRDVLDVRCRALLLGERLAEAEETAAMAIADYPDEPLFHAHYALAIHRQGRTEEALERLERVAADFPESSPVAYGIACLNGALGRLHEIHHWLVRAFEFAEEDERLPLMALLEPDLQEYWRRRGYIE